MRVKMKKILVIGSNSYIGNSFVEYMERFGDGYQIDRISVRNNKWREYDFSKYNTIFDVAGIAHIKITPDMEDTFYKVNRDLTIELCQKAKSEGVEQFIFLSSMNVYGDTSELITKDFKPCPKNFYGNSKLQADIAIQKMNTGTYKVVSIRPPVVYGKGCKGNYPRLAKLVGYIPFFPDYKNIRSMIFIDNLCELIRLIIENAERGIFHPQNQTYTSTIDLVKEIAKVKNKRIFTTKLFNPIIHFLISRSRIINRMFADDYYDKQISNYHNFAYCVTDFETSIKNSEEV
jgi:UDP-glucose 4-epimerase